MKTECLDEQIVELELECTTFCNARCPLCYRNYKSFLNSPYSKPFSRRLESVINQLDRFVNLNFVMLVGSMSEPTLYKDFIPLVLYLKNRGIKIEICTNGDTNNEQFWKNLGNILSDDDMVYFTICGSTQELHERYRRGTNLKNIISNASYLRNSKKIDYAQCIRFEYNTDDFDSKEFKNLISQFSHIYMTETFYPKNKEVYNEDFYLNDFLPCRYKLSRYIKLIDFAKKRYSTGNKNPSDCMCARTNRFQMDVFGNIYPCYLFLESMNGIKWNQDMNDIRFVSRECCMFCDKLIQMYAKRNRLEYVI